MGAENPHGARAMSLLPLISATLPPCLRGCRITAPLQSKKVVDSICVSLRWLSTSNVPSRSFQASESLVLMWRFKCSMLSIDRPRMTRAQTAKTKKKPQDDETVALLKNDSKHAHNFATPTLLVTKILHKRPNKMLSCQEERSAKQETMVMNASGNIHSPYNTRTFVSYPCSKHGTRV